jgi:hypothetical protein
MLERFESGNMTACPVPRSGLAFRIDQNLTGTARANWAAYERDLAVVLTTQLGVAT